jgi:hypothetical protein
LRARKGETNQKLISDNGNANCTTIAVNITPLARNSIDLENQRQLFTLAEAKKGNQMKKTDARKPISNRGIPGKDYAAEVAEILRRPLKNVSGTPQHERKFSGARAVKKYLEGKRK